MPRDPNILLILTDQQRVDTLGFMGRTPCRTPNMDRLAREGISFDRALTPSPLCGPARAALFTGLYPHQTGMMDNGSRLDVEPVVSNALRERGYHLDYVGKWHLDIEGDVVSAWFDRAIGNSLAYKDFEAWCRENDQMEAMILNDRDLRTHRSPHMTRPHTKVMPLDPSTTHEAWLTDFSLDYLATRPADRPFFMVLSYQGPHPPFKIPEPYYSMYDPEAIPEPPNFPQGGRPLPGKPLANTTSYFHQIWLDHGDSWDAWKKSVAVYWGFVTMIDDQIGRLLQAVEEQGILDDTLIVFTTDHGEFLGNQGLWQKMMPYEEAIRVPLIMRYPPRIRAGLRSQAVVSLVDIMPTIMSVVGESVPQNILGRDLSPAFQDGAEFQGDAYRFSEQQPHGEWHQAVAWRLVTNSRYKYVWNQGDLDELYDLREDPHELRNRIHSPGAQDVVERLQTRLLAWMVETEDPLLQSFEREVRPKG